MDDLLTNWTKPLTIFEWIYKVRHSTDSRCATSNDLYVVNCSQCVSRNICQKTHMMALPPFHYWNSPCQESLVGPSFLRYPDFDIPASLSLTLRCHRIELHIPTIVERLGYTWKDTSRTTLSSQEGPIFQITYPIVQKLAGLLEIKQSAPCEQKYTPPKTNMTIKHSPFEDVSPIENEDFPMSC